MNYEIIAEPGYLRAVMSDRETVEETREFFCAVVQENRKYRCSNVLLDLHSSRPIFHVERHGLFEFFADIAAEPSSQIALVGDTKDLRISHDYIAFRARQHGMNVKSFQDQAAALWWLLGERRQRHDRRQRRDQRSHLHHLSQERRQQVRRVFPQSYQYA